MSRRETVLKYFEEQKDFMEERVKTGIELYRKGYAKIQFVDKDGNIIHDVSFKATQKSHDFNFGCNIFLLDEFETEEKNKIYREIFQNFLTMQLPRFIGTLWNRSKENPDMLRTVKKYTAGLLRIWFWNIASKTTFV